MDIYDKFRELIIEINSGLPYEEAVKRDLGVDYLHGFPITLGRMIKIFSSLELERIQETVSCQLMELTIEKWQDGGQYEEIRDLSYCENSIMDNPFIWILENWKLTKENSQECTHLDQDEETIRKLYNLISKKC